MIKQSSLDLGDVNGYAVDLALNPTTYFRDLGGRVPYLCDTFRDLGRYGPHSHDDFTHLGRLPSYLGNLPA